jgi:hypothetical protein
VTEEEGLHRAQLDLGSSDRFWTLVGERRREKTLSRVELEEKIRLEQRRRRSCSDRPKT